jgi:phosphohistidine phosphatase SixA
MAARTVGAGGLVDPSRLARVLVSSRKRARHTFEVFQQWVFFYSDTSI